MRRWDNWRDPLYRPQDYEDLSFQEVLEDSTAHDVQVCKTVDGRFELLDPTSKTKLDENWIRGINGRKPNGLASWKKSMDNGGAGNCKQTGSREELVGGKKVTFREFEMASEKLEV